MRNVGTMGFLLVIQASGVSGCTAPAEAPAPPADARPVGRDPATTRSDASMSFVPGEDASEPCPGCSDAGQVTDAGPPSFGLTRVFHDDFEDGTTAKWGGMRSQADVTTSEPRSGTYSAQSNWNGTVAWDNPESIRGLHLSSWPYAQEFLVRFWMRVDADVDPNPDGGAGGKLFRLPFAGNRAGNEMIWARSSTQISIDVNGHLERSIWGCASFEDHAWHKVEIYIRDATDGAIRTWFDDVETTCANSSGAAMPYYGNTHDNDAGWDDFSWPSNWSGAPGCCDHDAENHMYLDDVEIFSDVATGEPVDGSLADGTAEVR